MTRTMVLRDCGQSRGSPTEYRSSRAPACERPFPRPPRESWDLVPWQRARRTHVNGGQPLRRRHDHPIRPICPGPTLGSQVRRVCQTMPHNGEACHHCAWTTARLGQPNSRASSVPEAGRRHRAAAAAMRCAPTPIRGRRHSIKRGRPNPSAVPDDRCAAHPNRAGRRPGHARAYGVDSPRAHPNQPPR